MDIRTIILMLIQGNYGKPYRWGGDDPLAGFDCSGFSLELLYSTGMYSGGDLSAQGLHDHLRKSSPDVSQGPYQFGDFAFYGTSKNSITHIAFVVSPTLIFEFGGGGSATTSTDAAIKANAYGRFRPVKRRKDLVAVVRPKWPTS